jgi:hypothetical protein
MRSEIGTLAAGRFLRAHRPKVMLVDDEFDTSQQALPGAVTFDGDAAARDAAASVLALTR